MTTKLITDTPGTMTEELKACPFCGDDEELRVEADNACACPCYWWVICGACGGRLIAEGRGNAIAGWNERASRTPTEAEPGEAEVERVARAMEPRVWQAFDGYVETFSGALEGYSREECWNAFIYGSAPVKGHDWGAKLQITLEHARAAIAALRSTTPASDGGEDAAS